MIELRMRSLAKRGAADRIAIFTSFIASTIGAERLAQLPDLPHWLPDAIAHTGFRDNVRERRNLAEPIGVTGASTRRAGRGAPRASLTLARNGGPMPASSLAEAVIDRSKWDMNERNRALAALNTNGWRPRHTARYLGISSKVRWENMRKYQIFDEEPETRETE
ncbi:hypothetical protein PBS_44370 [Paraburkholderia sp. 2C]